MSAFQQMVLLLRRLVGFYLVIETRKLSADDLSLVIDDAVTVRFTNRGQFPAMIDNQIILLPGESYTEGDTAGPGIRHKYEVRFLPTQKASIPLADTDIPFVMPGNFLDIRLWKRQWTHHA